MSIRAQEQEKIKSRLRSPNSAIMFVTNFNLCRSKKIISKSCYV